MIFNDKLMPEVSLNVYNDKNKNFSVIKKIRKIRKDFNETESSELLNSQVFSELSRRSMPNRKRAPSNSPSRKHKPILLDEYYSDFDLSSVE